MARLGALKPLRGTETSLANIVLQEGELAFAYPSTGPGTGSGGIKMGNGTSKFKDLNWYINDSESPTPSWKYDEGNNENALLNNIQHCSLETIGKIYYIQSYINSGNKQSDGSPPTIQPYVPYKVIGINHEGTYNTMDLQAMVAVNYITWNYSRGSWEYGKYSTSGLYDWIKTTCPNGYSSDIQAKMATMTERWREATGNATGTLRTRSTKCKLLNPVELFGTSAASYIQFWTYANTSDYKTKFLSDNYGTQYSIWSNSTSADTKRIRYHNTAMTDSCDYWTNSWIAFEDTISADCFMVFYDGSCLYQYVDHALGVVPVIRLRN